MSLYNLCFGSYRRNLTSPLPHWHRGTAFHVDTIKSHPEVQVVHAELGADMVVLTMAARITQSIFFLARNLLHRRQLGWKVLPEAWRNKALQAVFWMCWNILDLLLAVEVTSVYVYKNTCKHCMHCHTKQTMNSLSMYCHQGCDAKLNKMLPEEEELSCPKIDAFQNTDMDDHSDMDWDWDHKVFSDTNLILSKETLLPSCTNPIILSMICVPSEECESSISSEESILSSDSECEEEESEEDSSMEDTSVDSGMQESWSPKSKEGLGDSEESDWSSEEDDSWDEESEADCSKDDDLWASFCRNDDPYNPLSFAMPTRSPTQHKAQVKFAANCEDQISAKSNYKGESQDCKEILKCTMRPRTKKPILSSFKSSHNCASKKDECDPSEELTDPENASVKKVRFSSNVTVHHMITWSYAYRTARKGPWEEYARDSCRFQKRVSEIESKIGYCLKPQHREKIWAAWHCTEN
ncbi:uncharacterized protein PAF06_016477 [Gastrophryne carolinensis]